MQCLTNHTSFLCFSSGKSSLDLTPLFQISREQLSHDHIFVPYRLVIRNSMSVKFLFLSGRTTLITCVLGIESQYNTSRVAPTEAFNMITIV